MANDKKTPPSSSKNSNQEMPDNIADIAIATVLMKNQYQRDRHYFLMRIILVLMIISAVSITMNFYLAVRPPYVRFIAMDKEGRVVPLTPISEPLLGKASVTSWAAEAVTQAFTMDYANYKQELMKSRENFTPTGWSNFNKALQDSQYLQKVVEQRYLTTAAPTSAPLIEQEGHVNGRYAWKMQIPIVVSFQNGDKTISLNYLVKIVAVREAETDNPRGIGIEQVIVTS